MQSLSQLCTAVLHKKEYYKIALNISYAELIWQEELNVWKKNSTIKSILWNECEQEWFSYPEYSKERKQIEPRCWDGTHLMTNLRTRVCDNGLGKLKKAAWHEVARAGKTPLKVAMAVDLIDKQDIEFAKSTFSEAVETSMRELGFPEEADFCQLARNWYRADDEPGISAKLRVQYRVAMKKFLVKDVNFGKFPPYGGYVKGKTFKMI